MGWLFRKSFKILPGIRANLGKRGPTGFSFGRGGWFSTNFSFLNGLRNTFSIPGTGLSFRTPGFLGSSGGALAIVGVVLLVIFAVCGMCGLAQLIKPVANTSTPRSLVATPYSSPVSTPIPSPTKKGNKKATPTPKPTPEATPPAPSSIPTRRNGPAQSSYIRGPRGGCYYMNSRGNKTYVDRSLCN